MIRADSSTFALGAWSGRSRVWHLYQPDWLRVRAALLARALSFSGKHPCRPSNFTMMAGSFCRLAFAVPLSSRAAIGSRPSWSTVPSCCGPPRGSGQLPGLRRWLSCLLPSRCQPPCLRPLRWPSGPVGGRGRCRWPQRRPSCCWPRQRPPCPPQSASRAGRARLSPRSLQPSPSRSQDRRLPRVVCGSCGRRQSCRSQLPSLFPCHPAELSPPEQAAAMSARSGGHFGMSRCASWGRDAGTIDRSGARTHRDRSARNDPSLRLAPSQPEQALTRHAMSRTVRVSTTADGAVAKRRCRGASA